MTDVERLLWRELRNRRFQDIKFRRQRPIGNYIVDFAALDRKMIVEVDGGQHNEEQRENDEQRTRWLEQEGYIVLRFWNNEVLSNLSGVMETIIGEYATLTPARAATDGGLPRGQG